MPDAAASALVGARDSAGARRADLAAAAVDRHGCRRRGSTPTRRWRRAGATRCRSTVVEIDQKSLAALGQWPWPRTRAGATGAQRSTRAQPAAIGINVLMPEADRAVAGARCSSARARRPGARRALCALPSNDAVLARALAGAPSCWSLAGTPERHRHDAARDAGAGARRRRRPPRRRASRRSRAMPGALTSIDELDRAARAGA